jgi:thiol-disulfide isomerase/thioredoxin
MFKKIILILLCVLMTAMAYSKQEPVFYDTAGNKVQLSKLKGKWVVVNYWADWCPTCMREIPELNDFYRRTRNTNIVFYSVNYDGLTQDDLKNSITKAGVNFPVLTENPGEAWDLGTVEALPTTFILNPQGKVVEKKVGYNSERSLSNYFVENGSMPARK